MKRQEWISDFGRGTPEPLIASVVLGQKHKLKMWFVARTKYLGLSLWALKVAAVKGGRKEENISLEDGKRKVKMT